jgi:hypothetical protein
MLRVLDRVATDFGMHINAAKSEIQIESPDEMEVDPVQISSGLVGSSGGSFRYLGSWDSVDGISKEMEARRGKALGVFKNFSKIWSNRQLRVSDKMSVYKTFIQPHFLYGCETWNYTEAKVHALEVAHNDCLRQIMGVRRSERHSMHHIHQVCGSEPLGLIITRQTLRWLGHVFRMDDDRYPKHVLDCVPVDGERGRGRPPQGLRHTYGRLLTKVGIRDPNNPLAPAPAITDSWDAGWKWLLTDGFVKAQDKPGWRGFLHDLTTNIAVPTSTPIRRSARRATGG